MKAALSVLLPALLAVYLYWSTLRFGLVYDDRKAVTENVSLNASAPWSSLLFSDYWGTPLTDAASHTSWRPLTVASFRLTGAADAAALHGGNVALHAAATALLSCLGCRLFRRAGGAGGAAARAELLGGAAAALFAAHPVHVEAVANVAGRAELLSLALAIAALLAQSGGGGGVGRGAAAVLLLLAILSKETAIATLVPLLGWGLLQREAAAPKPKPKPKQKQKQKQGRSRGEDDLEAAAADALEAAAAAAGGWADAAPAVGAAALYLLARFGLLHSFSPQVSARDNHIHHQPSFLTRALSYAHLHAWYLWLLAWPAAPLSADYSFDVVPIVSSVASAEAVVAAGAYLLVGALLRWCWRLARSSGGGGGGGDGGLALWCALWAATSFAPATNVLFPVATVIGERLLYAPSAGACLLLVHLAHRALEASALLTPSRSKKAGAGGARLALGALAALTLALAGRRCIRRCADWRSDEALFGSVLALGAPYDRSARAHYNHAMALHGRKGDHGGASKRLAMAGLVRAVELDVNYAEAWQNLGATLEDFGQLQEAERAYKGAAKAARSAKESSSACNSVGRVMLARERPDFGEAEQWLRRSLKVSAGAGCLAHFNLARLIRRVRPANLAGYEAALAAALECDGNLHDAHNFMGSLRYEQKRMVEALAHLRRAVQLRPNAAPTLSNLGGILVAAGKPEEALPLLKRALYSGSSLSDAVRANIGINIKSAEQVLSRLEKAGGGSGGGGGGGLTACEGEEGTAERVCGAAVATKYEAQASLLQEKKRRAEMK